MRLKPEQLADNLQKKLAPVYFLYGDEPLQIDELSDAIRQSAKKTGFLNREILSTENAFEWHELSTKANSLSIFDDKKILDIRVPAANFGNEGTKALQQYCEHLPQDTLLMISSGKLNSSSLKTKWFEAIDKVGVTIQVRPLDGQELLQWLHGRLQKRGLSTDNDGLRLLASRIEGNLLAAVQEIEKLYILYGSGHLTTTQIFEVVADSSRFDVFKLVDSVLNANLNRIFKILEGLKNEGIAAPVILWALTRETRNLAKIKYAIVQGQSKDSVFRQYQIWDKRISLISNALARLSYANLHDALLLAGKADRQTKGRETGDSWETILAVCLILAGKRIV